MYTRKIENLERQSWQKWVSRWIENPKRAIQAKVRDLKAKTTIRVRSVISAHVWKIQKKGINPIDLFESQEYLRMNQSYEL